MRSISVAAVVAPMLLAMAGPPTPSVGSWSTAPCSATRRSALLEAVSCGPIPDGAYWLDTGTGVWGFADDPTPQGHIKDACANAQRRPSLSERGLLYSPGELLR